MKRRLLTLLMAAVLMFTMVGCQKKTLEDYYKEDSAKQQMSTVIDTMLETYGTLYNDIDWEVSGNKMTYIYTFSDMVDESMIDTSTIDSTLKASIGSTIAQVEKEADVSGVELRYIYKTSDGTVVFDKTYE